MTCPTDNNYFFSLKLDNNEIILKCVKIKIGTSFYYPKQVIRKVREGYLAVTNKRYLIADSNGVYSLINLTSIALTKVEVAIYTLIFIIGLGIVPSLNSLQALLIYLAAIPVATALTILITAGWKKVIVGGIAEFYKSDPIGGGEIKETKLMVALIWSHEVSSKELTSMLPQYRGLGL